MRRSFAAVCSAIGLILVASAVHAQGTASLLPPPPALAIAQRLVDSHRYAAAVKKLADITSSSEYKNTPYAPESVYESAHILRDQMHNDAQAIQSYNDLTYKYADVDYPGKQFVPAERSALIVKLDKENSSDFKYKIIEFFVSLTGFKSYSYWLALLLISLVVRLALTPLTIKQYKSMRETQRLQPLIKELQAKYKDNKELLGTKMMALYKEHGVNPAAGCIPLVIQLPVYWFMYQAIVKYQYHFYHGTFLWINGPLHKMFPAYIGGSLGQPDLILLFLYSISMYVTQRMMPAPDPSQAEMQKTTALMMSVLFFVMFQNYHFPSAFVLYWLISNIVSTTTQYFFMQTGNRAPAGTVIVLPRDGDAAPDSAPSFTDRMLSGRPAIKSGNNGSQPVLGTAKGVIAPRIHQKKKRR